VLPVDAFSNQGKQEADERIIAATSNWWCDLSLAGLMSRFFGFYCNFDSKGFRWGEEVVSVRCGERHSIYDPVFSRLRGRHVHRLHVEDPYQFERNLHCVLGEVEEDQLYKAFWGALHELLQSRMPYDFAADSLVDGGGVAPAEVELAGNTVTSMKTLLEQNKNVPTIENTAESTDSGGTTQEQGSDSESWEDSFDTFEVCAIPWPGKLCTHLSAPLSKEVESEKGCAHGTCKAEPCANAAYRVPETLQFLGADWDDHFLPQITHGFDHMDSIWSGTMITESL
jgi:hypothetical protein